MSHGGATPGAAVARGLGEPVIDAQPVHVNWVEQHYMGAKTMTFQVFYLTTRLHELMDKVRARTGKLPDVLVMGGTRIDMEAHRDTPLHELPGSWAK